jgi:2-polyprenyl-6-methoxyphenol hydroxylase-like FAD-dependent oxidoreductase
MSEMNTYDILIAGASGLAAASSLMQASHKVEFREQAPQLYRRNRVDRTAWIEITGSAPIIP